MNLPMSMLVLIASFLFPPYAKAREIIIPTFSELYSESDVVIVASLESVSPTANRVGNVVEAIARVKIHVLLKGECGEVADIEHLISATELPGVEGSRSGNPLRRVKWNTRLRKEKSVLLPEDKKLYFIFAQKTDQGALRVYRTKSRDCYGVFELSGADSDEALFRISETEAYKARQKEKKSSENETRPD